MVAVDPIYLYIYIYKPNGVEGVIRVILRIPDYGNCIDPIIRCHETQSVYTTEKWIQTSERIIRIIKLINYPSCCCSKARLSNNNTRGTIDDLLIKECDDPLTIF